MFLVFKAMFFECGADDDLQFGPGGDLTNMQPRLAEVCELWTKFS